MTTGASKTAELVLKWRNCSCFILVRTTWIHMRMKTKIALQSVDQTATFLPKTNCIPITNGTRCITISLWAKRSMHITKSTLTSQKKYTRECFAVFLTSSSFIFSHDNFLSQKNACFYLQGRRQQRNVFSEAEIQEGFQASSFADVSTHLSAFIRLNACITIVFVC